MHPRLVGEMISKNKAKITQGQLLACITSDTGSTKQCRPINLIIPKINTVKIFTLHQILCIGTRQKWPQVLGTRQNLVLGSALTSASTHSLGRSSASL